MATRRIMTNGKVTIICVDVFGKLSEII